MQQINIKKKNLTPFLQKLILASSIAIAQASLVQITAANTQLAQHYQIAAGSLNDVLLQFASQTGIELSFDPLPIRQLNSTGLKGNYTVEQGLENLLAPHRLRAVRQQQGYVISKMSSDASNVALLNTLEVEAQENKLSAQNVALLPAIMVNAESDLTENTGSYRSAKIQAGNKIATSLKDTPRSVSVITRQQLDDQRMIRLQDAISQLPGVTLTTGTTGYASDSYYTRGYAISDITIDGSPSAASNPTRNTSLAKYDSVQLLRGPDGLFSGSGVPSGTINLVRKRPLDVPQLKTTLSVGSWQNYYTDIDLSSPLTRDHAIKGRTVFSYNDRDYFYNNAHREIYTIYGIIEAALNEQHKLFFGGSYDRNKGSGRDNPPHFPRFSDGGELNVKRSQGYTDWSFQDHESYEVFTSLESQYGNGWNSKVNLSYSESKVKSNISSYNNA